MLMLLVNVQITSPDTDALLALGQFSSLEPFPSNQFPFPDLFSSSPNQLPSADSSPAPELFSTLEPLPPNRTAAPSSHLDDPAHASESLASLRDENFRLRALSAELMLKNEQLRSLLAELQPDYLRASQSDLPPHNSSSPSTPWSTLGSQND